MASNSSAAAPGGHSGPTADIEPRKLSAVDRLAGQIRELVRERELRVGDALPTERELGELFQVGRNTVREALQILRAYGIVEIRPKTGVILSGRHEEAVRKLFAFQNDISPASFLDVQGYRRIIEVGVGDHLILHASSEAFDRLDEINARMLAAPSAEIAARRDFEFHEVLVELAGNRTLLTNYRLLEPAIVQIMRLGKSTEWVPATTHQGHQAIIKALRTRDRVAYAYLMGQHLEFGLRFIEAQADGGG